MPDKTKTLIYDFTEGPIFLKLIRFAIPFMMSNAMQVLYSLVDMVIVGRFVGSHGLSAVSLSSQSFVFLTMICNGFCNGGTIYISQLIGKGDRDKLNNTIGTLFTMILGIGILVSIISFTFSTPFLRLLNTPPEAFDGALSYMLVCSIGLVFCYAYNMFSAVLRGMGDSRHPFTFIVIASIINILLDLLFVVVFHWGVTGAALATVIGQAFSGLYAFVFLYRNRAAFGFDFKLASFRPSAQIAKGLVKLGVPMAVRSGAINISMLFVLSLVARLGHQYLATFGAGIKLDDTANKIAQGVMMALAGVVGQNYGARKYDRIKRAVYYTWLTAIGLYIGYVIILLFKTELLFGIFTDDNVVLSMSKIFARAIVWHFPALLIMKGTNGFINGIGHAWLGLIFALLDGFVLRVAFTWFFGIYLNWGFHGFVLGYGLASYGMAIPMLIYFLMGTWKNRKLVTEQ